MIIMPIIYTFHWSFIHTDNNHDHDNEDDDNNATHFYAVFLCLDKNLIKRN